MLKKKYMKRSFIFAKKTITRDLFKNIKYKGIKDNVV